MATMLEIILQSLPLAIVAAVPLLLAVEGELVVERAGMINLGIGGMMLAAAMTSVVAAALTNSAMAGFASGVLGAAMVGALFGLFAIVFAADQIVTGTAINLFALGVTGFVYRELQTAALFSRAVPRITRDL